jgi:RNase P subunit RPR2
VKRKETRKEAARIAEGLIESASETAVLDTELAKEQAALARNIALKFNLRFDWRLKRFFCHGCKCLLVPGMNARVRLGTDKMLLITCEECGQVNRKKLKARLNMERGGLRNSLRV